MSTEDRRKASDEEEDQPLPPQAVRAGHLLPRIDPVARKARETAEGVVNGLVLVSQLLSQTNQQASGRSRASTPPPSASAMGGRLLPPLPAAASSAAAVPAVAAIGRMLLGPTRSQYLQDAPPDALKDIPDEAVDDREVLAAEMATAVGLLLLLHKGGSDAIADDESMVRRSLMTYAQEDRQEAADRAAISRADRFFNTRLQKLTVEEAELRLTLWHHQCHEFLLHMQRLQWVEYFLLTSDESSERERLVSMSHVSRAILAKNSKQEFALTCVMQHQVFAVHQYHLYQRWFLCEVECPTSIGSRVEQMERRERNKLATQMEKEGRWLRDDAAERRALRATSLYDGRAASVGELTSPLDALGAVEAEALGAVEDVQRRRIAREFTESFQRFAMEQWEEPMHRGVIRIARERWFRDLVRPSQHRVQITISEEMARAHVFREQSVARREECEHMLLTLRELLYQETVMTEQRDFRRLTLMCLKERRQREARQRESLEKREHLQRYLQSAIVGTAAQMVAASSPSKHPVLEDALHRYMAATATDSTHVTRSAAQTPQLPDYSVMLRAKQQVSPSSNRGGVTVSPSTRGR